MDYSLGDLVAHIHWVLAKPAIPGWEDIRQTISGHTLYYIYNGQGIFRRGGNEDLVQGGMLVYMRPGLPLLMESSKTHPLRMTMMLFDCAQMRKPGEGWHEPRPVEKLELPFLLQLPKERTRIIGRLFYEAEREWVPNDSQSEARIKSIWYRLIMELYAAADAATSTEQDAGLVEALSQLKEKLDRGFASKLRISELVADSGYSLAYMRRTFAARYGWSPKEYLDRLRNEHALRRIKYTVDSITDIARECGYQDLYQFSKAFKKRNGMSPTDYRADHQNTRGNYDDHGSYTLATTNCRSFLEWEF